MIIETTDPWKELQEKVEFLLNAESYPENTLKIESVQTHMSWIFLTEDYAYKLKKPVHFDFLKLDDLEARRVNAEQEVRLNQELAPGIYLGVVPLVWSEEKKLQIGKKNTEGEIVDWLVKMKRYPHHLTLDHLIQEKGHINHSLLKKAAKNISQFYLWSVPIEISPEGYKSRLERYVRENFEALSQEKYGLDPNLVENIHHCQIEILSSSRELFYERVLKDKIIECHGDLRPEHVCLTKPPIIVDRLEFSRELRSLDPVDELSYFAMECSFLGRPDIGETFMSLYSEMSFDHPHKELVKFYSSFRAALRSKISAWHLDDHRVLNKRKFIIKAQRYLDLAKLNLG
jgi:uncharacterized protein